MKLLSSALMAALLAGFSGSSVASEVDAREVFAVAAAGGMTFTASRVAEDVSLVFLHFTPDGRASLISELERTAVVSEVVNKRLAVRGDLPASAVQVRRRAGSDGLDEYDMSGDMRLQWSKCTDVGCVPSGTPKTVKVSGVVVQSVINGRPAYRVRSVRYEGGRP